MISKIFTVAIVGLKGELVEVEVDIRPGIFKFNIVGLPDKAVQESKQRVVSAIRNSGFEMPYKNITVNLAPAELLKTGSFYDLPIALGILVTTNQCPAPTDNDIFWGELSLNGDLRKTTGALAVSDSLLSLKKHNLFLPQINAAEAGIIAGIKVFPAKTLTSIVEHCAGNNKLSVFHKEYMQVHSTKTKYDFKNVVGQREAKRVLEIAAAGGHNVLLTGSPGSGKTYLARSIPGIMPKLSFKEAIEVTKIYSVSGLLDKNEIINERPFRSPHHTSSMISIVGGGSIPKPGEITLANRGVLFLDEFNEFETKTLEALRQPIEDKVVNISRVAGTMQYPANFMLIAALNPCKCGYLGDEKVECICSAYEVERYNKRISGPILDRIDLQQRIKRVDNELLTSNNSAEPSNIVQERVEASRLIQKIRAKKYGLEKVYANGDLSNVDIKKMIKLSENSKEILRNVVDKLNMSARGYFRLLRVARTIADLSGDENVSSEHIAEAVSYRL